MLSRLHKTLTDALKITNNCANGKASPESVKSISHKENRLMNGIQIFLAMLLRYTLSIVYELFFDQLSVQYWSL